MAMGERGMLGQFAAVLVGRPKAWSFEHPRAADEKERYRREQADAVVSAVREYNPAAPVVVGLDVGHTDPQYVVPHGGLVTVDAVAQRVRVAY
jgi:muramoyltetrapeptide carboxypeptidase LdcA involved in peptidoglycan recycling